MHSANRRGRIVAVEGINVLAIINLETTHSNAVLA